MAELPDEVIERLSVHAHAKVTVGAGVTTDVPLAPLSRQLFFLVTRGGALEQALLEDPEVSIYAEDRAADWSVRVSGRAVVGRAISAEPRRPELMHWVPDTVSASGLVAVRLHPEAVEYIRGKGKDRSRIEGPIPGARPPGLLVRWATLATEGVVVGYFVLAALNFVGLLYLEEEEKQRFFLLVLMVFAGSLQLAGLTLMHQSARFQRWREGLEPAAEGEGLTRGWASPRRMREVGSAMLVIGLLLAIVLGGGAGWQVAVWTIVSSGIPLLGPFFLVRHLLRRRDAALEIG